MRRKKIRKRKPPRPKGKPGPNGPWIRTVRGIKYMWIWNYSVRNGGYWRRLPRHLQS